MIREKSVSMILALALKPIGMALNFFIVIVLARVLGVEEYGVYAFAFAFITLFAMPIHNGLSTLVVRESAKNLAVGKRSKVNQVVRWAVKVSAIFSIFISGLIFLFWIFTNSYSTAVMLVGILWIFFVGLYSIESAKLRGIGKIIKGQMADNIYRPAIFIILLMTFLFYKVNLSAGLAMLLHGSSAAVVWLLFAFRWQSFDKRLASNTKNNKAWLKSTVPLTLIAGFQILNSNIDAIMVGFLKEASDVGLYRIASQTAGLIVVGLSAVNQVLHPIISKLYHKNEIEKLSRIIKISSAGIFFLALIPFIILFFFGREMIAEVFGDAYSESYWPLIILASGQLLNAFFGSVGAILNMTGYERYTLLGMSISLGVNILLNLALVPLYGALGAAVATAIACVCWNAVLWFYVKKKVGIKTTFI